MYLYESAVHTVQHPTLFPTFVYHIMNDVPGVYINNDQRPQRDPLLFIQFAAYQLHNGHELVVQFLVVFFQSADSVAERIMYLQRPVDLGHTEDNLARPVLHPVLPRLHCIRLREEGERGGDAINWQIPYITLSYTAELAIS